MGDPDAQDEVTRTCPECGQRWTLDAKTARWFSERLLRLPRRCPPPRACRKVKRERLAGRGHAPTSPDAGR